MEIFSKSHVGLVREENQDNFKSGVVSKKIAWAVVCDGMGGANGGNVASSIAVDYISSKIEELTADDFKNEEIKENLIQILEEANIKIFQEASKNIELTGMGTTCEFILIKKNTLHLVHIGDSRTYIINKDKINQITEDHSVVNEMLKRGDITLEEAKVHPNRNFITRALGIKPRVNVDYIETSFKGNDILLMCTDGLSNYVSEEEIVSILKEKKGNEITQELINKALEAGGRDNVTVTVIY